MADRLKNLSLLSARVRGGTLALVALLAATAGGLVSVAAPAASGAKSSGATTSVGATSTAAGLVSAAGQSASGAKSSGATTSTGLTSTADWAPQPPLYSVGSSLDQPVTASDGTVLRADVYFPTDPATSMPANATFPVLLQQTPYGKQNIASSDASAIANTDIGYFVQRGYIVVISDVRGTGDSGGTWGLFDPAQATDGATLATWAANLPQSDGKVGLFGESYMGINQFLTVGALGARSPVKAMFPVISANDLYRDTVTQGGILDAEFSSFYLALVGGLNAANPVLNPLEDLGAGNSTGFTDALGTIAGVELDHAGSLLQYDLPAVQSIETGGDEAYDQSYYAQRNPVNILQKVVADKIPAFLVGGWNDLFQRGELLNYTGLQNAYDARPVLAPMSQKQSVTPRYQLMMGPWDHVTTGTGVNLSQIELEWFDSWLLGESTPVAHTSTPLHLYELNAQRWVDTNRWPIAQANSTKYYFGSGRTGSAPLSINDGALELAPPSQQSGSDTVLFTGVSSPCDIQTDQWSAGLLALASQSSGIPDPCDENDATLGAGPGALTYTTAPFSQPETLAGPIDATVLATATTTDTELVATIEEVSPSGDSVPLTSGALLGSFRSVDPANSWIGSDGAPLLPYHPYTAASAEPVVPGELTSYDIEVFPTFAEIPAGWRVRVTISTSDTPHLVPTLTQLPNLLGGVYEIQDHSGAASFVNLPIAPVSSFATPCSICS